MSQWKQVPNHRPNLTVDAFSSMKSSLTFCIISASFDDRIHRSIATSCGISTLHFESIVCLTQLHILPVAGCVDPSIVSAILAISAADDFNPQNVSCGISMSVFSILILLCRRLGGSAYILISCIDSTTSANEMNCPVLINRRSQVCSKKTCPDGRRQRIIDPCL